MLKLWRIMPLIFWVLLILNGAFAEESIKVNRPGNTFLDLQLKPHRIKKRDISTDLFNSLVGIKAHLKQLYDFHKNQDVSIITNVIELKQKLQEMDLKLNGNITDLQQQVTSANAKIDSLQLEKLDLKQKLEDLQIMLQTSCNHVAKPEQKIQDSELEILKLHQSITEINNKTRGELDEMKQAIQNIGQRLNQTIETSKLNSTKRSTEIVQSTSEVIPNQKRIRVFSFNETAKLVDKQNGGCGGILVGLSGEIRYESLPNVTSTQHSKIRCVWTIRANKKIETKLQLVKDELAASELCVNGLWGDYPMDLSNQNKTLRSGHHREFTLYGWVIFVTLIADSAAPLSFTLKYEGIGGDTAYNWLYSHYHFTESAGSVDFPKIRRDTKYSPFEVATFVINPTISTSSLRIQTTKVDTDNAGNCQFDTLLHIRGKINQSGYYQVDGSSSTRNSYCGQLGSLRDSFSGGHGAETFISIFISDGSNQYSGFTFNWSSLPN